MKKVLFLLIFLSFFANAMAATLHVGSGQMYTTIQAAVDAASDDDLIYIHHGTYREVITTEKKLDFRGESRTGVIWTAFKLPVGNPSWSKTVGYSNVYECDAPDVVSSGKVFAIIDEDRRGKYQQVTSVAEVDALPGRHYTTGGKLYVRCPDDASPSTHTLWYSVANDQDLLVLSSHGGQGDISNITFVGSTQYLVNLQETSSSFGTVTLTNCDFYCGAVNAATSDSVVGGTINISNCRFLYNCTPVYDVDYPIWTDEDGNSHTYRGGLLSLDYMATATLTNCIVQFSRNSIYFSYGNNFTVDKSLITNTVVHPISCRHPNNNSVYTIKNSIFAMHGSTIYTSGSDFVSEANDGSQWYVYNNTFYAGEQNKMLINPTENPANTDFINDVKFYFYNNAVFNDFMGPSLNGALDGDNIFMDNNFYALGNNGDVIRYNSRNYTLSEWQAYTDGQGWRCEDASYYTASLGTVGLVVEDETDTNNADFGKVSTGSPLIGQASAIYAPADDYWGTPRPQGTADDIGVHEVASDNATPSAQAQSVSVDENSTDNTITLTGSDADGDTLTYTVTSNPANGTLSGTAPDLYYTPDADYTGSDSFSFIVNDGTIDSSAAVVTITVQSGGTSGSGVNNTGGGVDNGGSGGGCFIATIIR